MRQAMLMHASPVLRDTGSILRRSCSCGATCTSCRESSGDKSLRRASAAAGVPHVLRSPGIPLDQSTRGEMERLFAHNFSRVRVHSDEAASRSADALGAKAYTLGNDIAFSASAYAPHTSEGKHLLAHELAHTVQQQSAPPTPQSAIEVGLEASSLETEAENVANAIVTGRPATPIGQGVAAVARAPKKAKGPAGPPQPEACGRKSNVRVAGFDGTAKGAHISAIDVSIKANAQTEVTLKWANLVSGTTVPANPLPGSPGAGLCKMLFKGEKAPRAVDCSDVADSNTPDSLCTPIGDFKIQGFACQLSDDTDATRVSWFMKARGIAFHNYPSVPAFPASHGCVRMGKVTTGKSTVGGGDWIHDNTIPDITTVHVQRPAGDPGPECWTGKKRGARPGYTPPAPAGSNTAPSTAPDAAPKTTPGVAGGVPPAVSFDETSDGMTAAPSESEFEEDDEAVTA